MDNLHELATQLGTGLMDGFVIGFCGFLALIVIMFILGVVVTILSEIVVFIIEYFEGRNRKKKKVNKYSSMSIAQMPVEVENAKMELEKLMGDTK